MLLDFNKLGWWKWALAVVGVFCALFMLLPIVFIVALSFGSSQWLIFPPPHWTTHWYSELFADPRWLASALTSLKIAVLVTILSVLFGLLASFGMARMEPRPREATRFYFLTPMVLPVVVLAVALYAFFLKLGINGTLFAFVIAHLVIALPFSVITISGALAGFDRSIEDAAVLCGATPWQARLRVTMPAIRHGIFAAALFSFLISWDEVVLAIFMASPTLQTLPVRIWGTLRQDLTPVIAAASSLLVALTLLLLLVAALLRKGEKS